MNYTKVGRRKKRKRRRNAGFVLLRICHDKSIKINILKSNALLFADYYIFRCINFIWYSRFLFSCRVGSIWGIVLSSYAIGKAFNAQHSFLYLCFLIPRLFCLFATILTIFITISKSNAFIHELIKAKQIHALRRNEIRTEWFIPNIYFSNVSVIIYPKKSLYLLNVFTCVTVTLILFLDYCFDFKYMPE